MATATQILDRASQLTGLRSTGTERTLAFQAVQNAYMRAVMDSECYISSASNTLTAGTSEYNVSALCASTVPMKLREVLLYRGNGQDVYKLHGIAEGEMLEKHVTNLYTGTPEFYSVIGTHKLRLFPVPAAGDLLHVYYVPVPPTLVESTATPGAGEEITPSYVPVQFHWDVLMAGTVLEMLDKDQRAADVQFWASRYADGIARMKQWSASFMGDANPMWIEQRGLGRYLPDSRIR